MRHPLKATVTLLALITIALAPALALADDWPTFRHDPARSGVISEQIATPLNLQWTYVAKHPPHPAWPEPGKEMHRMPFDYAYQVASSNGKVYFGSSADHKVYAVDRATGEEQWSFFTDAPVRFAPMLHDGRLLVGSDDGWLYCLSADNGMLLWQFYGGPRDDRVLGNEHMISRWPLRSGVIVVDDIVYLTAGMWPAEGVYVYALRVEDGSVLWKNDSSGSMYMKLPHPTAEGFSGVAPQGHIVASGDTLLVPTGRSLPGAFDRATGRFLYYRPAWPTSHLRQGGSWVCAAGDLFFCGCHPGGPDIDVRLGEAPPARGDGLMAWDCATGDAGLRMNGKHRLALTADTLYASGSGNVTAYDFQAIQAGKKPADCVKWETPHERAYSLIVAGDTVLVGGVGTATALAAADGAVLWQGSVDGQARGLAASDGALLVSTSTGQIVCFGSEEVADPPTISPAVDDSPYPDDEMGATCAALAERILQDTGVTEGYCLDFGAGDGRLAYELAKRSDLNIYCLEPDGEKVAAARKALDAAGLYGVRVTVHQAALDKVPYPDYFANLIVVGPELTGELSEESAAELYRTLGPCGGIAYLVSPETAEPALKAARVLPAEITTSEAAVQVVRGALPGAGEWTHQYGDPGKSGCSTDELVKWPLRLLWFGGPGPELMISRHWRPSAPVAVNGRLFIGGQHNIIAVDAYNGRELWMQDIPSVGRMRVSSVGGNLAADGDSVYAATGSVCFRLDAATGMIRQLYRLPIRSARFVLDQPQSFELPMDEKPAGTITVESTDAGLQIALVTVDDNVTNLHRQDNPTVGDCWELFLDFGPAGQRGALYGPATFQVFVVPATNEEPTASYKPGAGAAQPALTVSGTLRDKGSETTVLVPWAEVEKLAGGRPADFAFGATLDCSDDGEKRAARTHKFANADSHRLTNAWATFILDPQRAGQATEQPDDLLPPEVAEKLSWSYFSVGEDSVLGSVGTASASEYVFAIDKDDGSLRWLYTADQSISPNAIAMGDGVVFLIDKTSKAQLDKMARRGEEAVEKSKLVALDLATGETVWETAEELAGRTHLSLAPGVLLAFSSRDFTAYAGGDGKVLWTRNLSTRLPPVICGDTIYTQPYALDLNTGEHRNREHPLTGDPIAWSFYRAYGCGGISGSPNLLFFRSGAFGFCDLAGDTGTHNFGGVRPGCYINLIAANGLVLAPNADSACTCAYNYQTSVALAPAPARGEDWGVFSVSTGAGTHIRQLRVNLGATGDRRDGDGKMWLGFPRPIYSRAVPVPMVTEYTHDLGYYRRNADDLEVHGSEKPWLYASGITGLRSATLDLVVGKPVVAPLCEQAAEIDGALDDACWDGRYPLPVADGKRNQDPRISAYLRTDADNLYLAFECKAAVQDGAPVPWKADTTGEDASVWGDDSWQIFLTDGPRKLYLHLGVSASGARYDAKCTYARRDRIHKDWNGEWLSEVTATPEAWTLEMAVPWQVLTEVGLNKDSLRANILGRNRTGIGPETVELRYPGCYGFSRCDTFSYVSLDEPAEAELQPYTVRLYFIELDDAKPGQRVFDVKLQDQVVLEGLDVVQEAAAGNTALVKEFEGIEASDTLSVELVSRAQEETPTTVPVISAIEVHEE